MNWFEKIKSLTTKPDNSPELKKGEIKNIIIHQANRTFPDFDFLNYKNSCYTFQRIRKLDSLNIYETLHIVFTLKDHNFACSIASRLNPKYININSYNTGLINPHKDLITLKKGTSAIPIEEAYYFHNGKVETTTKIIEQIFADYKQFGIPFLNKQYERLKNNEIIKAGLEYIKKLEFNEDELEIDIENQLREEGNRVLGIKNPIFIDLKEKLQSIKGQTKEDRQEIPKLTFELLELYYKK